MTRLRVVIADDEPLVRRGILRVVTAQPDLELAGEARNGAEALALVEQHRPDLLLLDVQMPGLDGFEVLQALENDQRPVVVFVTAHDRYALRAFEEHAVDYLLKPFDDARLEAALERARTWCRGRDRARDAALAALLDRVHQAGPHAAKLLVREQGRIVPVLVPTVDWIEAADNYVRLHVGDRYHLLREPLGHLEARLDPAAFQRIHRSTIVNLARVVSLQPLPGGESHVHLSTGKALVLSRGYRDRFRERWRSGG